MSTKSWARARLIKEKSCAREEKEKKKKRKKKKEKMVAMAIALSLFWFLPIFEGFASLCLIFLFLLQSSQIDDGM
jgi:uncharacterized membrane protein